MTMADDDFGDSAPYEGEVLTARSDPPALPVSRGHNPFHQSPDERINAGAVAIESQRASAEVQGRMVIAKRFPRDSMEAYGRAMKACQRLGLAECAIYSYNKGTRVEGPSIRLAEELARVWGNIEYGINELSRATGSSAAAGTSEMEAFAWDLETNTRSSQRFTVAHIRDKNEGGKVLTTERDIYEITANMGARRMRARILAILPPELVDDAVTACKETIRRGNKDIPFGDRVRTLTTAFGNLGVNPKMLGERLGHSLDDTTPDELVDLSGVYQQIKDGAKVSEFFGAKAEPGSRLDTLEKALTTKAPANKTGDATLFGDPKPGKQVDADKADGATKAARALIARIIGAATADDLHAIINAQRTVNDRAGLEKSHPVLARDVTAALDRAAARLAKS